jgi:hypothetical protein
MARAVRSTEDFIDPLALDQNDPAGVQHAERSELAAGWVSWLLAMKAAVDFSVDLRNHDPDRTWQYGYADN